MMNFTTEDFGECLKNRTRNSNFKTLLISSFCYEERSTYICDSVLDSVDYSLLFTINDYKQHTYSYKKYKEYSERVGDIVVVEYSDAELVQNKIIKSFEELKKENESISVHIDYSSMPRGWYCNLPKLFQKCIRKSDTVYFWYAEGNYLDEVDKTYPTVGVDSYNHFNGKFSLEADKQRVHLIGLGYDSIRTQGIVSVLDPDFVIAVRAYNQNNPQILSNIESLNSDIINQAGLNLTLFLDDMATMIYSIRSFVLGLHDIDDYNVIIIPDGPKPLIFAMSIMSWLIDKDGISCIHVARNRKQIQPQNVKPTGSVLGFSIKVKE